MQHYAQCKSSPISNALCSIPIIPNEHCVSCSMCIYFPFELNMIYAVCIMCLVLLPFNITPASPHFHDYSCIPELSKCCMWGLMCEWMCGRDEFSSIWHLFYISFIDLCFTLQQNWYLLKTDGNRQLAAFLKMKKTKPLVTWIRKIEGNIIN